MNNEYPLNASESQLIPMSHISLFVSHAVTIALAEILHLDNNNFRGTLPSAIFSKVTRLTELHLSSNEFDGHLSTRMGKLRDLSE